MRVQHPTSEPILSTIGTDNLGRNGTFRIIYVVLTMVDMLTNSTTSKNYSHRLPRRPLDWLKVFGPGAIIASLTIGTGELIFSSRGGAIFGYRILFLFVLISVLKWGLVVASSRHMVLTGVHPYQRMLELPGPRGWLTLGLFLIAAVCLPIWISFHSGVLGNLMAWITGTSEMLGGGIDYLWGIGILAIVVTITALRGYSTLERIQLIIVAAMLFCAGVTLILYHPDWLELLKGAIIPQCYTYPQWLSVEYPHISAQPVWIETTRYVGVIGGAGFDYLAYTSFMRDKAWGQADKGPVSPRQLTEFASDPAHPVRQWIRAPLIDCSISFLVVIAFSTVFVASGNLILGPNHKIPDEKNLLNLQSAFVTSIHPWLLPLYIAAVFLTMVGTLYGTLEVACSITSEMLRAVNRMFVIQHARRIRHVTIIWCTVGACAILLWLFTYQSTGATGKPRLLLAILTPANLFTGVLGCGLFCLMNLWMDRKFLPKALRLPKWLWSLNLVSGCIFLALGLKGYWDDQSRWCSISILCAMLSVAGICAHFANKKIELSGKKTPHEKQNII